KKVLNRPITGPPELRHDAESWGALHGPIADGGRISVPAAPQERIQIPIAQTAHRFGESALKEKPTLLAICNHGQASPLLQPDGILHSAIFDGLEPRRRDPACSDVLPRRDELEGTKQAADVICVISDQG